MVAPTAATEPAPSPAESLKKKKPAAEGVLYNLPAREWTPEQSAQLAVMLHLAKELGYVCQDRRKLEKDLAQHILARMTNRLGKAVYQTIIFTMAYPRDAAVQLFPANLTADSTSSMAMAWESSTMEEAAALIGNLLNTVSPMASGLTRALKAPSESVVRVFSTLMPTIEMKHVIHPHGADHLQVKATYALFDDSAELHPPKSADRLEMAISRELDAELRQRVLQDALQLSEHLPLSANWWRQLGKEEVATQVEAGLITHRQRLQASQAPAVQLALTEPAIPRYDVLRILAEERTTGAAQWYYLVEWEGYDASWESWRINGEPGTAITTWEPLKFVRNTVAWKEWQATKEAQREAARNAAGPSALARL